MISDMTSQSSYTKINSTMNKELSFTNSKRDNSKSPDKLARSHDQTKVNEMKNTKNININNLISKIDKMSESDSKQLNNENIECNIKTPKRTNMV